MLEAVAEAFEERWSHAEELAALQAELLDALVRVTVQANSDPRKPRKQADPFRYPRPHKKATEDRRLDRLQVRRVMLGR